MALRAPAQVSEVRVANPAHPVRRIFPMTASVRARPKRGESCGPMAGRREIGMA
jgi:hypothetical protein